jgi:HEAT repeat protein
MNMPELASQLAELQLQMPMMLAQGPEPPVPPSPARGRGPVVEPRIAGPIRGGVVTGAEALYTSGINALSSRQYDRAISMFDQVIAQKSPHADGALYWKAFGQYKLAKTEDALAAIAQLRKDYGQSRYLSDAKVLEADVRKASGQPVNLEAMAADEDIKILAIQGIQKSEPEKAVPLLEGVLQASNSLRIKKQAIYVLALSGDAHAHDVLLKYAKGGGNPDLQAEAIRYLASRSDRQTTASELKDIYESTQDPNVRRAVLDAYRAAGDKAAIFSIASNNGQSTELRSAAVTRLNGLASAQDLWDMFQKEPDAQLRLQIVNVLVSMNATDQLAQVARTDKDAGLRRRAIQGLGNQKANGTMLIELYASEQDRNVKMSIIDSLAVQGNAEALVALARKETTLDFKRQIVQHLSDMAPKNKVAADYLMEVIK